MNTPGGTCSWYENNDRCVLTFNASDSSVTGEPVCEKSFQNENVTRLSLRVKHRQISYSWNETIMPTTVTIGWIFHDFLLWCFQNDSNFVVQFAIY